MKRLILALVCTGSSAVFGASTGEQSDAVKRIRNATTVLSQVMAADDSKIPDNLLDRAHCVVIVPGLKQGGFIVGAKYGKGVITCRAPHGSWRSPGTVRLEGGSVGFQIGAGEVDLILLVMDKESEDNLLKSSFKIGGEASAMAGPVGRSVQANTDALMHAKMLAYSRSRGAFAGVAIEGTTLRQDLDDNKAIYGRPITNRALMDGAVKGKSGTAGRELIATLNKYSTWEKK